ncbi:MAG: hypothetical protein AAB833_01515 [Patescibacteria group bacterium]
MFSFNHGVRAISFTVILAVSLTACGESPFGEKSLIGSTVDGKEVIGSTEDGGLIYEEEELTGLHTTEYGEWTGTVADDPAVVTVEMSILDIPVEGATVFLGIGEEVRNAKGEVHYLPIPVGLVGDQIMIDPGDLEITAGEADRMSWDDLPLVWDQASGMEWGCRREPISLAPGSETTIDCPANAQFDAVMECTRWGYGGYNEITGQGENLVDLQEWDSERVWMENGYLPVAEGNSEFDYFFVVGAGFELNPDWPNTRMISSLISPDGIEIYYWDEPTYKELICLPVPD